MGKQSSLRVMISLPFTEREVSFFPLSIQMEEGYWTSPLESDVSASKSEQDSSETEDLKYSHIWTLKSRKLIYF